MLILFSDGASFNDLDTFSLLNSDDMTAVMTENMKYMQRKGKKIINNTSLHDKNNSIKLLERYE